MRSLPCLISEALLLGLTLPYSVPRVPPRLTLSASASIVCVPSVPSKNHKGRVQVSVFQVHFSFRTSQPVPADRQGIPQSGLMVDGQARFTFPFHSLTWGPGRHSTLPSRSPGQWLSWAIVTVSHQKYFTSTLRFSLSSVEEEESILPSALISDRLGMPATFGLRVHLFLWEEIVHLGRLPDASGTHCAGEAGDLLDNSWVYAEFLPLPLLSLWLPSDLCHWGGMS